MSNIVDNKTIVTWEIWQDSKDKSYGLCRQGMAAGLGMSEKAKLLESFPADDVVQAAKRLAQIMLPEPVRGPETKQARIKK